MKSPSNQFKLSQTDAAKISAAVQLEFVRTYGDFLVHEQLDFLVNPRQHILDQPLDFKPAYVSTSRYKNDFAAVLSEEDLLENQFKLARQNYLLSKGRIHRADRQQWLFASIWRSEFDREEERPAVLAYTAAKKQLAASFFDTACAEHSTISCEYWGIKRERNGDV